MFHQFLRENSNNLDFFPPEIINFGTKIQVNFLISGFVNLNFWTKNVILTHCVLLSADLRVPRLISIVLRDAGFRLIEFIHHKLPHSKHVDKGREKLKGESPEMINKLNFLHTSKICANWNRHLLAVLENVRKSEI